MIHILKFIGLDNSIDTLISIGRSIQNATGIKKKLFEYRFSRLCFKRGIEMDGLSNIGEGLILAHPFGITVHSDAHIGKDCVIFKGATIGSIRSGPRKGVPRIGNRVMIGTNSFIVGNIIIGDDVMICANSFVDFDVPSNSIVIGNPGSIHAKNKASQDYCSKL